MRNYLITIKEYLEICTSPQIDRIKYNPYDDTLYLHTKDNYETTFKIYKKER